MFRRRRLMSWLSANTCSTRSHNRVIADSASSMDLLKQISRVYHGALKLYLEKGIANHCRIVGISVHEDLLLCSLRCISATLDSFVAHFMRFKVSISASCIEVPKTSSSSEEGRHAFCQCHEDLLDKDERGARLCGGRSA